MKTRLVIVLMTMLASVALVVTVSQGSLAIGAASTAAPSQTVIPNESAASPALPQPGDLSFGQNAGSVLIGLTVRPAQPGPNTVFL